MGKGNCKRFLYLGVIAMTMTVVYSAVMDVYKTRTARLQELVQNQFEGNYAAFCRATDENPTYISRMLKGTKPFSESMARRIEKRLSLIPNAFDSPLPAQVGSHQTNEPRSEYNLRPAPPARRAVPVITVIQAGQMKEIGYLPEPGEGDRWETPDFKLGPRGGCAIVDGWSMWNGTDEGIKHGDLIFWDPDLAAMPNDLVIAKHVDSQSATFKQLSHEDGKWYLRPLNKDPIYKTIEIDDPAIRVIAVVTEYRRPSKKVR
jgi:SOS-response transcriptional repressor LexA